MRRMTAAVAACVLAAATVAAAQESGIHVRSVRVLATDPAAIATFYERAFGMSETRRPVDTATFTEIVINSGSTPDLARQANGGTLMRPAATTGNLSFAFVKDPDGNQIELIMSQK